MARTIRDAQLDSRTARARLKPRGKPYYREIERGLLHLGYRKPKSGTGKWLVRLYDGNQSYTLKMIGPADDFTDADGNTIRDYAQAQACARQLLTAHQDSENGRGGAYKVRDAIADYLKWLESEGRTASAIADAKGRCEAFILPELGDKDIDALTKAELQHWRDALAKAPPRVRSKRGEKPKHRDEAPPRGAKEIEEYRRRRRSTVKRVWTTLRAALNLAYQENHAKSDGAWGKVKPYRGVDAVRVRYLDIAEAQRHANATSAEFRPMVQAALLTGARYGQLARLIVADFDRGASTLRMTSHKGDGTERVSFCYLTDEGAAFFKRACAGRAGHDLIFTRENGAAWQKSEQARPMKEASKAARITPAVNFHCLRHTYASHAVMNGAPLHVVAKNLGHSDTRMVEKHYGHLAPSYIADAIRAAVPRFDFPTDRKVVGLDR